MVMKEVYLRKLTNKNFAKMTSVKELSCSKQNVIDETSKELFRRLEINLMRFTSVTSHLMYNETCLYSRLRIKRPPYKKKFQTLKGFNSKTKRSRAKLT